MGPLAFAELQESLEEDRRRYASGGARFVALDHAVRPEALERLGVPTALAALGDGSSLTEYRYFNTHSYSTTGFRDLPAELAPLIEELHSAQFLRYLEDLTGIRGLLPDRELANGGVHFLPRGGFLSLHRDELDHPVQLTWKRRLNLMVYLHPGWRAEYGGALEVWSLDRQRCLARIEPRYARCVVTELDDSLHGVPDPVACPPETARRALVLWFYTDEKRTVSGRPARFYSRPGDPLYRRLVTFAEAHVYTAYQRARRRLHLQDSSALRFLRLVGRLRGGRRGERH